MYTGRVQGVGFRLTTERLASGFQISGYVQNLADGSVEVVAFGAGSEVDQFLEEIERKFGTKIQNRVVSDYFEGSSEPSGFMIRY